MVTVAASALAAGAWADVAALVLLAFLLVTTFFMHPFWKEGDPQAKMGQQVHFLKNLGVAGGGCWCSSTPTRSSAPPPGCR